MPLAAIITVMIILFSTIGLIVWDIVVAVNDVPNRLDTISGRMRAWGNKTLLFPWAWAVLFGHFYGPKIHQLMPRLYSISALLALTAVVIIGGIFLRQDGETTLTSWPLFLGILNLGAIAGALLWPQ